MALRCAVVPAIVVVALTTGCADHAAPKRALRNSLVLIDPADATITDVIRLGGAPTRVSYARGGFWVAVPDAGAVVRVDASSHDVKRFKVGAEPYDVAVGGGAVWIPDHDLQRVFRLDPATGTTTQSQPLGGPAVAVGYGFGAVWAIVAPGSLVRLDPHSLAVTHTTPNVAFTSENAEPKLLFEAQDGLVVSPASAAIAWFAPNGALEEKRDVNGLASAALGRNDVWLTTSAGTVTTLGGRVRTRVGFTPRDLAATADAVWVAVYAAAELVRVRTDGTLAATVPLNRLPVSVAATRGSVAVAVTQ